jgi:hypothetical protein
MRALLLLVSVSAVWGACEDWCNVHTCESNNDDCRSCDFCQDLANGEVCESWCNKWNCDLVTDCDKEEMSCPSHWCQSCDMCSEPYWCAAPRPRTQFRLHPPSRAAPSSHTPHAHQPRPAPDGSEAWCNKYTCNDGDGIIMCKDCGFCQPPTTASPTSQ